MTWPTSLGDWYSRTFDSTNPINILSRLPHNTYLLISGLDCSGKKTLLIRHLTRNGEKDIVFSACPPQMRGPWVRFTTLEYGNFSWQKRVQINSYDVGGGRPDYYFEIEREGVRECDALIWMIDSTDNDRWVETFHELCALIYWEEKENVPRTPLLIMANKQGLRGKCEEFLSPEKLEEILISRFSSMLKDRHWIIVPTDVLSGEGLGTAFEWLVSRLNSKIETQAEAVAVVSGKNSIESSKNSGISEKSSV